MTSRRLVCRNIADGTGAELFSGRITIDNHYITAVERGDFAVESASDTFFDENVIVCPAFIDAHGHSDLSLMAMPDASGKTAQGIGWEVSGNCGLSPFPLTERNREHLQELYAQYGVELDWHDYTSYMQNVQRYRPAMGLFPLTGHNTLRAAVAGYEKKHLSSEETNSMLDLLDKQLKAGSPGISFGLLYVPGCFAEFEEIVALMQVVARRNKLAAVHLRSEGNDLEGAIDEMISAARAAGLKKLHLSHLKTSGLANFHKISFIEKALQTPDICVTGDVYCYDASMTQLSVIMPEGFDKFDDITLQHKLADEQFFRQVLPLVEASRPPEYWQRVRLLSLPGEYKHLSGQILSEAAQKMDQTIGELYLNILKSNAAMATAAYHTLSRENMEKLAAMEKVVPGSDESARSTTTRFGSSHPRGFGNHAEYFALRQSQGAEYSKIISEITGKPAQIFNLLQVGCIAPNHRARLTILDPEKYQARATYEKPHQTATGAELRDL